MLYDFPCISRTEAEERFDEFEWCDVPEEEAHSTVGSSGPIVCSVRNFGAEVRIPLRDFTPGKKDSTTRQKEESARVVKNKRRVPQEEGGSHYIW